ncbi:MAG: VWA domain-containing protein [Labilithrix sp.]|nr:VWA domain-containing protein [Labilithrix sp.]
MSLRRRVATASILGAGMIVVASCGSRTGLFGVDALPDGAAIDGSARDRNDPDAPVKCTPGRFTFDLAIAQLMFVVDRSGSMSFALDGTQPGGFGLPPGVLSRWEVLRDGLAKSITPYDTQIAMGAKFYPEEGGSDPNDPDDGCRTDLGVAIAPAPGNARAILDVFTTSTPIGGTPTSEAIRLAAQYITGTRGVARTMVVATDGAPNCNGALNPDTCTCTARRPNGSPTCPSDQSGHNCLDDLRTIGVIRNIFDNQKIPVYVIGIGGSEQPAFIKALDDMAVAGGRAKPASPKFYNVQTATEMDDALASISSSVAGCTYLTPSAPLDPNAISVEIDGVAVPRDPTRQNGWDWVDQAYGTLAFFGSACDAASKGVTGVTPKIGGVVRCESP